MANNVFEYKCPCCGGSIQFDSKIQKMKCPYCDTEFEMGTLEDFDQNDLGESTEPVWDDSSIEKTEEYADDMTDEQFASYICESCGGEIIAEKTMGSSSCPYCGNPVVVMKQFSGMLKPELIIPFKLDKKDAEKRLKEHFEGKTLLPSMFKSENRIKEVKGVYVPFWLFDSETDAEMQFRATRTRTWKSGSNQYTETSHYMINRAGNIAFDKVPADGSSKMDDTLMESIEPFDYSTAVPFQTGYLAGFMADKYDVKAEDREKRVNERMKESTERCFSETVQGYETCVQEHSSFHVKNGKITYALLPVWVLSTQYKGESYTFAMNGQTGKFVGNLPADKGKAYKIAGLVFAGVTVVAKLILGFIA